MTDIFGTSFDKTAFIDFVEDFLPDFERDEHPVSTIGVLEEINQLGTSDACKLSVFEIRIDEANSEKRIAITQDAFKMLRRHRVRNALIAFHYQSENWRLSLLTSTLEIKDGKIISKTSNPRRYSYLLGRNAKVNTPRKFLMTKGNVTDIRSLQDCFSVDVVNKEFYNAVAECFMELVGGERGEGKKKKKYDAVLQLPGNNKKEMQEFSVRLIGRIMFCWFLKEKRNADGCSLVPSELLSLGAISKNSDYYHTVLEPLFFGCLNTPIPKRVNDLREKPFNQIPYLNGGLFSDQTTDHYNQNNFNGRGTPGLVKVPDEWFTKLYGILNQYNFTVDENTSFDIDLSIDPEMLGRIFENLLAEINPETGKTARKATGSFYTPREIVDYMVDNSLFEFISSKTNISNDKIQSLMRYSKEDDEDLRLDSAEEDEVVDALADLAILDPACGSGAFPMGILQKVFYVLQQVDPNGRKWYEKQIENIPSEELRKDLKNKFENGNYDYIRKLGVIRQSIFGVDIQAIATEIAKLRCFLTLIIEERVDDTKDNRGIHPLPNLDFKFVAANSLIELPGNDERVNIFDSNGHIETLRKIRNEYFTADENERLLLRARFAELQKEMFMLRLKSNGATSDKYNALTEWNPFSNESVPWFDSEWMFGVKNFDIVIGNPPYGANITNEERTYYRKTYAAAKSANGLKGSTDTFAVFVDMGMNVVKTGGVLSYIVPMAVISSDAMMSLHARIERECGVIKVSSYSNRPKQIFDNACVRTSIIFLMKTGASIKHAYTTRLIRRKGNASIQELIDNLQFIDSYQYKMQGRYPKVGSNEELGILRRLFLSPKTVSNYKNANDYHAFYYRTAGGRYFNVVTTYPTNTSAEKPYFAEYAELIAAFLSTSLFWFYQQVYTDGLNLKSYEIDNFPLPDFGVVRPEKLYEIKSLYQQYLDDIERNAHVRVSSSSSTHNTPSFKEYKIVKSKNLIDKLDELVCPLYSLDTEQIEFIKTYELDFRLSGSD